jgi:hypothetical protein
MDSILDTIGASTSSALRADSDGGLEMALVDPCSDASWDRDALGHVDCTVFHSSAWARVLSETYAHKAEYISLSHSERLVALLPLMDVRSPLSGSRGVCLPFTDFCEPLIFAPFSSAVLVDQLASLARERKWKYFEIRGEQVAPPATKPAVAFYGHAVNLERGQDRFGSLDGAVRRAIRKAERSALEVRADGTRAAMMEFYRLHTQTRRRHGLPPQPVSFFLNIHKHIIEKGLGFVSLVLSGSRAVAAAVFFHQGAKAIFKFGASDQAYQELRPNNLAMWHGMNFLAESGTRVVHLGRTSMQNEGLRRFKLGWAAKESVIEYFKFETATSTWSVSADHVTGMHNEIFSRLPLSINRLMGTLIYPHLD